MFNALSQIYPSRIIVPENINDLSSSGYMVYILLFNGSPIVLGHGKRNRAKVIFDSVGQITTGHIKALFVRLYNLFGTGVFERYIINCVSKEEAKLIERNLHAHIGGNNRNIPLEIRHSLFDGIEPNSTSYLVLEIALRSSFDGLSDIKKWYADGILSNEVWFIISKKLKLFT